MSLASLDFLFSQSLSLTSTVGAVTLSLTRALNTATRFNSSGVMELINANLPRFDYNPTTLASLGLLIEESRSDLVLNSLLDGTNLGTQIVTVSAQAYTLSFYGTGTVTLTGTSTAGPLVGTGATDKVSLTFTPTVGALTMTVTGTVKWANFEVGAFATSFIPTAAVAVTRNADLVTLGTLSPWFNESNFTAIAVVNVVQVNGTVAWRVFEFDNGAAFTARIRCNASSAFVAEAGADGSSTGAAITTGRHKVACRFTGNNMRICVDGVLGNLDTAYTPPTDSNRLTLLSSSLTAAANANSDMERFTVYPVGLTDAQLQVLTT